MLKADFRSGAELMVNKHDFTLIMSTRRDIKIQPEERSPVIHLLHDAKGAPALLNHLAQEFARRGLSTKTIRFDDARNALLPNFRVVAFLDGENLPLSPDQHRIWLFQHLATTTTSMIWLTSCGIVKGRNPDGALVSVLQLGHTLLRFSKGAHIGKMVVSYQDPNSMIRKHKSVTLLSSIQKPVVSSSAG